MEFDSLRLFSYPAAVSLCRYTSTLRKDAGKLHALPVIKTWVGFDTAKSRRLAWLVRVIR
jgi:hypothetical protein